MNKDVADHGSTSDVELKIPRRELQSVQMKGSSLISKAILLGVAV